MCIFIKQSVFFAGQKERTKKNDRETQCLCVDFTHIGFSLRSHRGITKEEREAIERREKKRREKTRRAAAIVNGALTVLIGLSIAGGF